MISIFEWEGVRETADEVAMIIKTRAGLKEQVIAEVERLHPYDVPALLVLPTEGGSADYCAWIVERDARQPKAGGRDGLRAGHRSGDHEHPCDSVRQGRAAGRFGAACP